MLTVFSLTSSISGQEPSTVRDSVGQEYRLIDATHFEMGAGPIGIFRNDHSSFQQSQDDVPIHPVILSRPFYIGTTEVTVGQFKRFVEATRYKTSAERNQSPDDGMVVWAPEDDERGNVKKTFDAKPRFNWMNPSFKQDDSHPVVGVSYVDAKAYCDWLSNKEGVTYRLPTEAEWECACRAGTTSHFSFGDTYRNTIHRHANIGNVELEQHAPGRVLLQWIVDVESDPADGHVFTAPVGSYEANALGLHDMHGNVWEWCEDRYLDTFYSQFKRAGHGSLRKRAIDPLCQEEWNEHGQWQVIRGGSWFLSPALCQSSTRSMFEANDAACYIGFRVARDASPDAIARAESEHRRSEAALKWLTDNARAVREYRDGRIRVEIRCDDLTDEAVAQLQALKYQVDLAVSPPGRMSSTLIRDVAKIQHLTGFALSTNCDDFSDDIFAPLAAKTELEELQITGTREMSDLALRPFNSASHIASINLQGDSITDAGLASLPPLNELHTLHIASTQSQGLCLERFSHSPLRQASFGHLSDDGAALLAKFQTLSSLNIRESPITRRGLESIASIRRLENLQLAGCNGLSDGDFKTLSRLIYLRSIQLQESAAGDMAIKSLSGATRLNDLQVGSENLTDQGMKAICDLVSLNNLTITQDAVNVTDAGLADCWRLINLRNLSIHAPQLTGKGFATLAELPRLERLSVSSTQLTDAAFIHFATCESLKELSIGDWQGDGMKGVTNVGILRLAEAPNLKKLSVIRNGTQISDDVVRHFKQMRPDVEVNIR